MRETHHSYGSTLGVPRAFSDSTQVSVRLCSLVTVPLFQVVALISLPFSHRELPLSVCVSLCVCDYVVVSLQQNEEQEVFVTLQ